MYAASASADTEGSYGRIVANGIDSLPPLGGEGLLRGRSVHIHLPQGTCCALSKSRHCLLPLFAGLSALLPVTTVTTTHITYALFARTAHP